MWREQRVRQVPDRPAAIIDACRPDLDESQRRMESIRYRVWRAAVDFTDNALVSGFSRMFEQIATKLKRLFTSVEHCSHARATFTRSAFSRLVSWELRIHRTTITPATVAAAISA